MTAPEPDQLRRGSVWRVTPSPDEVARVGGAHWSVGRELYAIVLSASPDGSRVRVVVGAETSGEQQLIVDADETKVGFDSDDDAGFESFVVFDCANLRTYGNLVFARGEHRSWIRDAARMQAIDHAVILGLRLGEDDDLMPAD
ncbi:MAG: hypothetical protein JWL76_725 [Thermoleophilia bacterium]|nr:hypothetical protein [Thermoleophilia bacterium]